MSTPDMNRPDTAAPIAPPADNPVTGLDRAIDPRYPSNRFAIGAALVGGVIAAVRGASPAQIASSAAWTFSSWSLARELDPDNAGTATVAAGGTLLALLAVPGAAAVAPVAVGTNGALVLAARSALNSTGRDLKGADHALVALAPLLTRGAGLFGTRPSGLGTLGVSSLAALVSRQSPWWSIALAVAPVVLGVREDVEDQDDAPPHAPALAAGLLALGALGSLRAPPRSSADNGRALEPDAWRWAQAGVYAGGALAALRAPALALGALAVTGVTALLREVGSKRAA